MPELPEVETVKNQLLSELNLPVQIQHIAFSEFNLRSPSPRTQADFFANQTLVSITRRSKYLLFQFASGEGFLSHLGMTGRWRLQASGKPLIKHDHVILNLAGFKQLIYNDPRRFGFFEILKKQEIHPLLRKLGPEPLSENFEENSFFKKLKSRKSAIKSVIMNAEVVVGVGNIYASESLFRSGISPMKKAHRLKLSEAKKLMLEIRQVLTEAIGSGGSTIDDYRDVFGKSGGFQNQFFVYGRESFKCLKCKATIKKKNLSGRATYWCPSCQSSK